MRTLMLFALTAVAEIVGCYAAYAVLRQGKHPLWLLPGSAALILFAWLLTLHPTDGAGRVYAAYGGVYIVASLLWLWWIEGSIPDRWDVTGAALCLVGAGVIMLAPRS
jgi:small multidrug resistance family-3 protein